MDRNRVLAVLGIILLLVIGLVVIPGWLGDAGEETGPTIAAPVATFTKEVAQATTPDDITAQASEEQEAVIEHTETVRPTPRAALDATDPSLVSLGSGEIQLVEFFAYW